jgi:MFS family permease
MILQKQPIWTRSFLSVFMANLLIFTAFYLLLPTLPLYLINDLKIGSSYTGIVLAAYTIAALIIRPVTGFMIDIHGRKWIYLVSLPVFSILFGGYMFAFTLGGMILLRILQGFVWGVTTTSGNTLAVDLVPSSRRGEGLSYYGLSSTIPMAIGPLIGLWLVLDGNYNRMFISSVILSLIGFIIAMGIKYPAIISSKAAFSIRNLFERSALPSAIILILNMISYGGLVSFLSLYVKETRVGDAGLFFLIYAIGIAITRMFSGRLFDRQGPMKLTVLAFGMLILGFFLLSVVHNQAGFFGSAFCLGIGGGIVLPTLQAMVNNMVEPQRRGATNSTLFTALDLGIGVGMALTGFLASRIGLSNTFLIFCLLNGLALVFFLMITNNHYSRNKLR